MFAFTELPEDNSIYGEFYGQMYYDKHSNNNHFTLYKKEFDNLVLSEPIFHLNQQINLNDTQLITEIAKKAFEKRKTLSFNYSKFESFTNAPGLKKGEIALGLGPQIITRVRFLINVYNDRLKQKEDDQTHLLQKIEEKIEQKLEQKLEQQQLRFQEILVQQNKESEKKLEQQHKESMARIQVLETMILKYIVDK